MAELFEIGDFVKFKKDKANSFGYGEIIERVVAVPGSLKSVTYVIKTRENLIFEVSGKRFVKRNLRYISKHNKNRILFLINTKGEMSLEKLKELYKPYGGLTKKEILKN